MCLMQERESCPTMHATEYAPSARELQTRFGQRMFLGSEANCNADSESAAHAISVRDHLLDSVRATLGQQFYASPRCGWRDRFLPGGFHGEGRSRQAHL